MPVIFIFESLIHIYICYWLWVICVQGCVLRSLPLKMLHIQILRSYLHAQAASLNVLKHKKIFLANLSPKLHVFLQSFHWGEKEPMQTHTSTQKYIKIFADTVQTGKKMQLNRGKCVNFDWNVIQKFSWSYHILWETNSTPLRFWREIFSFFINDLITSLYRIVSYTAFKTLQKTWPVNVWHTAPPCKADLLLVSQRQHGVLKA